jgi:hypothetical protein
VRSRCLRFQSGNGYYGIHRYSTGYHMSTVALDRYILEVLLPDLVGHDRRPSAFAVYVALCARTGDGRHRAVRASLRELSEWTGLSKRAVQIAVAWLERRHLVTVERESPTDVPSYQVQRPWARRRS